MRVLVVKTSSLGDVIHALPAVTDAAAAIPSIRFDWVVEEGFAEVPAWHPAVAKVIPVALRRWRKRLWRPATRGEVSRFRHELRSTAYDHVIDAQGLIKSALVTRMARGPRAGLDRESAREPWASLAYQERVRVPKGRHAITRVRQLFARVLGYNAPDGLPDYGLARERFGAVQSAEPYVVFLHGTSWPSKHWPESCWQELARLVNAAGVVVRLPWGSAEEQECAHRIAAAGARVEVLPAMGLGQIAAQLASAAAVVGVDTGLAHLAAALGVPSVTLYGATRPGLTGTWGVGQQHLCADFVCAPCLGRECRYEGRAKVWPACYQTVSPQRVWQMLWGEIEAVTAGAQSGPGGET